MRRTLRWINLALFAAIALLATVYRGELGWAARHLPAYASGIIEGPTERQLYREAAALIDGNDWEQRRAEELLARSLEIDPYGEAAYWRAELLFETGRLDEAIEQFRAFLEFDPTRLRAYLKLSAIYEGRGQYDEALQVVADGLAHFAEDVDSLMPVSVAGVPERFNRKAVTLHDDYRLAVGVLERESERIAARAALP
jgi:tetratricopeptide (TPR) repeat protein